MNSVSSSDPFYCIHPLLLSARKYLGRKYRLRCFKDDYTSLKLIQYKKYKMAIENLCKTITILDVPLLTSSSNGDIPLITLESVKNSCKGSRNRETCLKFMVIENYLRKTLNKYRAPLDLIKGILDGDYSDVFEFLEGAKFEDVVKMLDDLSQEGLGVKYEFKE